MEDKQVPFREVTLTAAVTLNESGREGNNEYKKKKSNA